MLMYFNFLLILVYTKSCDSANLSAFFKAVFILYTAKDYMHLIKQITNLLTKIGLVGSR